MSALYSGSVFGVLTFASDVAFQGDGVVFSAVAGVVGGVFFGVVMGLLGRRFSERLRRRVGNVAKADQRLVAKAAARGPAPDDPTLREAARNLALLRAEQAQRLRWFTIGVFAAATCLSLYLAVVDGPGWLVAAAAFACIGVWGGGQPRQLRRRAERLSHGTGLTA